jgi:hypothetical protein
VLTRISHKCSGVELADQLVDSLRRLALAATDLTDATCGSIRSTLLKIGALVTISVRRIKLAMASCCPYKAILTTHSRSPPTPTESGAGSPTLQHVG